jgi:hypothetical protein
MWEKDVYLDAELLGLLGEIRAANDANVGLGREMEKAGSKSMS